MRSMVTAAAAILATATVTAACTPHPVGPARTYEDYERKATTTAEAALSAVETVRLAADAATHDDAFGPYTSVLISDQEETISGVQGTFASIQPPNSNAQTLRSQLSDLLGTAADDVAAVRIAARRGHLRQLDAEAQPLEHDAIELGRFVGDHRH